MEDFFNALDNFPSFRSKLENTKLAPNFTMLLYGPPGTGKTSLTRAFAREYNIPLCVVESHKLISSLLGETIKKLSQAVTDAAKIAEKNGKFIIFFDEIDAVGSERSNIHEVGEIKRAVISFLQTIDDITKKNIPLAIFGATNHQHQLDSAIWRRFTFHLQFDFPDFKLRKKIMESFMKRIESAGIKIDHNIYKELDQEYNEINAVSNKLEIKLEGNILESEKKILEELNQDEDAEGLLSLTHGYSGSDIERGTRVALFKAIGSRNNIILTYDMFFKSLKLVGGTATHVDRQDILSSSKIDDESSKIIPNRLEFLSYEEFIKEIPNIIPLMKNLIEIFKNRDDLKTEYFTGNKKLGEFINLLIEISKILNNKNILKLN